VADINDRYGKVSLPCEVKNEYLSFDYNDRYRLKDRDDNRCIFCGSARVSKEYENLLKQNALKIYGDAELFFKKE
jgi:predicted nucleotidyltransferase